MKIKPLNLIVRVAMVLLLAAIVCLLTWAFTRLPLLGELARWFFFIAIGISLIPLIFSFVILWIEKIKSRSKRKKSSES